jgi:hypothetical protein
MALKPVTDDIIESIIEHYESNEDLFFLDQERFAEEQPELDVLFTDESLDLLNDDEYELMWFIATVVYGALKKSGTLPKVEAEKLISIDEENWKKFENAGGDFYEKVTGFYENYTQEDLLAFVEDCLDNDDDDDDPVDITSTGKELIFITCKSMIDVLSA